MPRNRRSFDRPSRRIALAGALFVGLVSAGCFFIGDRDSRDEAEEAREDLHEAADELAESVSEAVEEIGEAMSELAEELTAGGVENPIDFREFYDFLPEDVGDFRRTSREGSSGGAFGLRVSAVEAEYESDSSAEIDVSIVDTGALGAIGLKAFADWLEVEVDEESDRGWARTMEYGGHPAFEEFELRRGDRGSGEFTWFVANRFVIELEGRDITADELYELRDAIDAGGIADLRDREGS